MTDAEQVLPLIGDIYDASLDPSLWPTVLEKIAGFAGGVMANLFSQDIINKSANLYFSWGDDPKFTALYLEKYARINPLYPAMLLFPVGGVFSMKDIISPAEMRQTRFYKEWLEPQGYLDVIFSNLEKTTTGSAPISIVRHERDGLVDDATRQRVSMIVPHIQRRC